MWRWFRDGEVSLFVASSLIILNNLNCKKNRATTHQHHVCTWSYFIRAIVINWYLSSFFCALLPSSLLCCVSSRSLLFLSLSTSQLIEFICESKLKICNECAECIPSLPLLSAWPQVPPWFFLPPLLFSSFQRAQRARYHAFLLHGLLSPVALYVWCEGQDWKGVLRRQWNAS